MFPLSHIPQPKQSFTQTHLSAVRHESQTPPGGFFDGQQSFEGFAILHKLGKLAETITYIYCRRIANTVERCGIICDGLEISSIIVL